MTSAPVSTPLARRPRRTRLTRGQVALGCAAVVLLAFSVVTRVHHSVGRQVGLEPLRAAQVTALATRQRLVTVSSAKADDWISGDGPSLSVAERYSAGDLLEPAFYDYFRRQGSDVPTVAANWRCLYVAVQPRGGTFDYARVSSVLRLCYADGSDTPMDMGGTGAP